MNIVLAMRLLFDSIAAGLLVFGFSYWWLGNAAHEIAGAAMFLLLILHNVFNRRFYRRTATTRPDTRGVVNIAATAALLIAMLALLVTSVLISNALADLLPVAGGFTVRQIHTLAAYWALVIVAVHLGLRWPMLMGVARNLFGVAKSSPARTAILRLVAGAIAIHGIWSAYELGLGTRLRMKMTLDWWDFEASVAGFFVHCLAVAGLGIVLTYYATAWLQRAREASQLTAPVAQHIHE